MTKIPSHFIGQLHKYQTYKTKENIPDLPVFFKSQSQVLDIENQKPVPGRECQQDWQICSNISSILQARRIYCATILFELGAESWFDGVDFASERETEIQRMCSWAVWGRVNKVRERRRSGVDVCVLGNGGGGGATGHQTFRFLNRSCFLCLFLTTSKQKNKCHKDIYVIE